MTRGITDPDAPIAPPEPPLLSASQVGGQRVWTVSRHADVLAVLRSPSFRSVSVEERIERIAGRAGRDYRHLLALLRGTMIFQQDERHQDSRRRVRALIDEALARWPAARLQAEARRIVAALPAEPGEIDVVPALAEPLPSLLIGEALGLPPALCLALQKRALAVTQSWLSSMALRDLDRLEAEAAELRAMMRANRAPGWRIGRLAEEASDDAIDLALFLLLAGSHSVAGTIAAALDILARQGGLQARLRPDRALGADFLRETLRLAGPLRRLNRRVAAVEAEIGGARILPGDLMLLPIDRAHRDPAAFAEPEHVDLTRKGVVLLAFGSGAHVCQGRVLGAQEAEVMVQAVLERFTLRPATDRGVLLAHEDWRTFYRLPLLLHRVDAGDGASPSAVGDLPGSCPRHGPGILTHANSQEESGIG
ncbi:cytochrome P450 [Neoroseomonas lacus]|uniref:Cytochrome P450 n=1 Tax=Neoroseomonas lacus TaxID=287609 RepID=A0A917KM24_9PROT|nr:cytochrome P450 [Neoroseomonas lacus]GGJ20189.1 cytochrome P450 [Neoroseomonas lacus]